MEEIILDKRQNKELYRYFDTIVSKCRAPTELNHKRKVAAVPL